MCMTRVPLVRRNFSSGSSASACHEINRGRAQLLLPSHTFFSRDNFFLSVSTFQRQVHFGVGLCWRRIATAPRAALPTDSPATDGGGAMQRALVGSRPGPGSVHHTGWRQNNEPLGW